MLAGNRCTKEIHYCQIYAHLIVDNLQRIFNFKIISASKRGQYEIK